MHTPSLSTQARPKRRYFTAERKRQIVEEAMAPGASVSAVTRAHDLNTNQVFKWCRELRRTSQGFEAEPMLLAVTVAQPEVPRPALTTGPLADGRIELHLARGRIILTGPVNNQVLNTLFDRLLA